jgi:hypothetical protein
MPHSASIRNSLLSRRPLLSKRMHKVCRWLGLIVAKGSPFAKRTVTDPRIANCTSAPSLTSSSRHYEAMKRLGSRTHEAIKSLSWWLPSRCYGGFCFKWSGHVYVTYGIFVGNRDWESPVPVPRQGSRSEPRGWRIDQDRPIKAGLPVRSRFDHAWVTPGRECASSLAAVKGAYLRLINKHPIIRYRPCLTHLGESHAQRAGTQEDHRRSQ